MSEKTKHIPFRLSPEKHKEIMVYAINHGTSVQKLLEGYVEKLLQENK